MYFPFINMTSEYETCEESESFLLFDESFVNIINHNHFLNHIHNHNTVTLLRISKAIKYAGSKQAEKAQKKHIDNLTQSIDTGTFFTQY